MISISLPQHFWIIFLTLLLCLLGGLMTLPKTASGEKVSEKEQQIVQRLQKWRDFSPWQREQWLAKTKRFEKYAPQDRDFLRQTFVQWQALTLEQREEMRSRSAFLLAIPESERQKILAVAIGMNILARDPWQGIDEKLPGRYRQVWKRLEMRYEKKHWPFSQLSPVQLRTEITHLLQEQR